MVTYISGDNDKYEREWFKQEKRRVSEKLRFFPPRSGCIVSRSSLLSKLIQSGEKTMQQFQQIITRPGRNGLSLFLLSRQGEKLLGVITQNTLRIYRDESRHYHRAVGGFGINSLLLKDSQHFRYVFIEVTIKHPDRKEIRRVSREIWISQGTFWRHYQNNAESQVILPLPIIRGENTKPETHASPIQGSLFGSEVQP